MCVCVEEGICVSKMLGLSLEGMIGPKNYRCVQEYRVV